MQAPAADPGIVFHNQNNFLIVYRQLFPPPELVRMRGEIEAALDQFTAAGGSGNYTRFGIAPDAMRLQEKWYSIWQQADLACLTRLLPGYTQITYPPQIRRVMQRAAFVPWHQDEAYMQALKNRAHEEIITCHLPLDDDPRRRPGLQFYLDPEQRALAHTENPELELNRYRLEPGQSPPAAACINPQLELGDALIFGKHVLHRTFFPAGEFLPRLSMEFRITTDRCLLTRKDYFDLKTMHFHNRRENGEQAR